MSCGQVVSSGAETLHQMGFSATEAEAIWATKRVAQVWELLPRCPACKHWVSPRTGVCNYKHCQKTGEQVAPATGWPPSDVFIIRGKAQVEQVRQYVKSNAPPRPQNFEELQRDQEFQMALAQAQAEALSSSATAPPDLHGDYHLPDGELLTPAGPKSRYQANVAAIRLLKQLEEEDRPATPQEQEVLARYTGWGALPQALDRRYYRDWESEQKEIQGLLTPEELRQARASTPNAHYTSPAVVDAVWQGLSHLGFSGGTVLEPAVGTGMFLARMPEHLAAQSRRVGVELDSITARIAGKLYPNAVIHHQGYEESHLPNDGFDVVVSNVPFGNYPVHDPDLEQTGRGHMTRSIHDYYFAKALDHVRPGGVVAFVTSKYTLDKLDEKVRRYLRDRADFLGAVRLPDSAFKGIADTEVVADIIFLQKRDPNNPPSHDDTDDSWLTTSTITLEHTFTTWTGKTMTSQEEVRVNDYFLQHGNLVMGDLCVSAKMHGRIESSVKGDGRDLRQAVGSALQQTLPKDVIPDANRKRCPACQAYIAQDAARCQNPRCPTNRTSVVTVTHGVRDGSYVVLPNGEIRRKKGDDLEPLKKALKGKRAEIATGLIGIRDAAREVLALNAHGASDEDLDSARDELNRLYDEFVDKHGAITKRTNQQVFKNDPDLPFLLALERDYDPSIQRAEKVDLFRKRVVRRQEPTTTADTAKDALMVSLNEIGTVDLPRMSALTGKTEAELVKELEGEIFMTPAGGWQLAEEYLSGDVIAKLEEARAAAQGDPSFVVNVQALEAVQPLPIAPQDIHFGLGASWLPREDVADFAQHLFGARFEATYSQHDAEWRLVPSWSFNRQHPAVTQTWGVPGADGMRLLDAALNGRSTNIYDTDIEGNRIKNPEKTMAAQEMADKIREEFQRWVLSDDRRARRLAGLYNAKFNRFVPRQYNGSHIQRLPGTAVDCPELRPHQKDAIWRVVSSEGNTLLGHVVGAGKTMVMCGASMEMKRLGVRRLPLHCVCNHMLEQYTRDFQRMYPGAKILAIESQDLSRKKRQQTMARIATEEWDAIIIRHIDFTRMPVSSAVEQEFIRQELERLEDEIYAQTQDLRNSRYDQGVRRSLKQLEKAKKRLEVRMKKLLSGDKEQIIGLDQTGIDHIFVDEAQFFKNLSIRTRRSRLSGVPQAQSQRAADMYLKTQYLQNRCEHCGAFMARDGVCTKCGGLKKARGGITFATGTPITNTIAECFNVMRYLVPERLQELGLEHFDAWAAQFGDTITTIEMKPTGDGYREKTRFARFKNVPELMRLWLEFADVEMDPEKLGLDIPDLDGDKAIPITAPSTPELKAFIQECVRRAEDVRSRRVTPEEDNMLKIVNDANKAALDMRLIDSTAPDHPDSKVNKCVGKVVEVYQETTGIVLPGEDGSANLTQAIFLDTSTPKAGQFDLYHDIKDKLVGRGIPEGEIRFIHDASTDAQKIQLFDDVNAGRVRVIIGSTQKMGSGTNIQRRLYALHHLDAPWRPADIEQREGRIIRQGNVNDEVKVFRYATEGSFDTYRWQLLEQKARFIAQVSTGDVKGRTMEDVDEIVFGYAEMKALATGDPRITEQIRTQVRIKQLEGMRRAHWSKIASVQRDQRWAETALDAHQQALPKLERAVQVVQNHAGGATTFAGVSTDKVAEQGTALMVAVEKYKGGYGKGQVGTFEGFPVRVEGQGARLPKVYVEISPGYKAEVILGKSPGGNIQRLRNTVQSVDADLTRTRQQIQRLQQDLAILEQEASKPFEHAEELARAKARNVELQREIQEDMDRSLSSSSGPVSQTAAVAAS